MPSIEIPTPWLQDAVLEFVSERFRIQCEKEHGTYTEGSGRDGRSCINCTVDSYNEIRLTWSCTDAHHTLYCGEEHVTIKARDALLAFIKGDS